MVDIGYAMYTSYRNASFVDYNAFFETYGYNVMAVHTNLGKLDLIRLSSVVRSSSTGVTNCTYPLSVLSIVDSMITLDVYSDKKCVNNILDVHNSNISIKIPLAIDFLLPDIAKFALKRSEFIEFYSAGINNSFKQFLDSRYGDINMLLVHTMYTMFCNFIQCRELNCVPLYLEYSGIELWGNYMQTETLTQLVGGAAVAVWPAPANKKPDVYDEPNLNLKKYLEDKFNLVISKTLLTTDTGCFEACFFDDAFQTVNDPYCLLLGPLRLLNHACHLHQTVNVIKVENGHSNLGENVFLYGLKFRDNLHFERILYETHSV